MQRNGSYNYNYFKYIFLSQYFTHNNLIYLSYNILIGRGQEQLDKSCVQYIHCEKLNKKSSRSIFEIFLYISI